MFDVIKPDLSAELIMKHEGERLKLYLCPAGKLTIGFGRNVEDTGITKSEAEFMLMNDIDRVRAELNSHFDWYQELNEVRKAVVENMLFNLGLPTFMGFKNMLALLSVGDRFHLVAEAMLDSRWAVQVGNRANELAEMMRTGEVKK